MKLQHKTAIVTGAGQGIGQGIARALAKEGCSIVVSDLHQETCEQVAKEIEELGGKALAMKCDVSKADEVQHLIEAAISSFGGVDILVNNAGIYPFVPFLEMKEQDWDKVMNVNLKGSFLCSQAAARVMSEGGKIICISSIASIIGYQNLVHYCASKGGINSMVRALALELAPKHITVNAIAPGAIETPGAIGLSDEKVKSQTLPLIPLKRIGTPEDIAPAVVFLASRGADYITGQTITIDGGWTIQ